MILREILGGANEFGMSEKYFSRILRKLWKV